MIEFNHISKVYGKKKAADDVSFTIETGSFVCLIGTSGSGKTTCMRMINRMIKPTSGTIMIDDQDIRQMDEVKLRRSIGYVIQQIGLMPHMTIYENIVTVPKLLGWSKEKMRQVAEDLMVRVDLDASLLDQYPAQLSGGMQQRIGVLRALAADQSIILMDEPFGALDPITRESLQQLVKRLQRSLHKTIVFVTHDMDEAIKLADQIVIMDKGKVIQKGSPKEILMAPANDFVRELIGTERLTHAKLEYEAVDKIMLQDPIKVQGSAPMRDAARLMDRYKVDEVLVVDDEDHLLGRVDLYALLHQDVANKHVASIIKEAVSVGVQTPIQEAVHAIQDLGYRNLAVVDDQHRLVGLVTRGVIVKAVYAALWSSREEEVSDA